VALGLQVFDQAFFSDGFLLAFRVVADRTSIDLKRRADKSNNGKPFVYDELHHAGAVGSSEGAPPGL
jgi:hypothetical protein